MVDMYLLIALWYMHTVLRTYLPHGCVPRSTSIALVVHVGFVTAMRFKTHYTIVDFSDVQ